MKKECQKCCDTCDIDFSKDNGYGYAIDELKAVRAHIDDVIRLMETRIEKDAILDEVLNTSYKDDKETDYCCDVKNEECICDKKDEKTIYEEMDFDEIIKNIIAKNNINQTKKAFKLHYPLWSMYPHMWF